MSAAVAEIGAVIEEFARALHARDAARAIATLTVDATAYDLAPPLVQTAAATHDPAGYQHWFDTWQGPIRSEARELTIEADGDLGWAHGLRHLTGTKVDGRRVDLWFRATATLRREAGAWRIAHMHNSVPFAMDGSNRALLDLQP